MGTKARSHYPEFAQALYRLQRIMGESRQLLIDRANFQALDVSAFDALAAALNTATAYFPEYVEQA